MHLSSLVQLSLAAVLFVGGCQSAAKPSEFTRATGREQIPVSDNWRQFAQSHYAGELLVELQKSTDVRFIEPVAITATRDVKTRRVELIVHGQLDETNILGKRLRHPFYVAWVETMTGWELVERQVLEGRTAPATPAPIEPLPTIRPATQPAAQ